MAVLFTPNKEKVLNRVVQLATEQILPNPHQPRKIFQNSDLSELAASIQHNGILQPLTVRRLSSGMYELISGERRLRAAKLVNIENVPCIIMDTSERNSAILALLENIQREDLNFLEEAYAIERLIDFYGMTQEDAALKLGKAQSTIANKLRILKLSDEEKLLILEYKLTERHSRALLKLNKKEERLSVIDKIHNEGLNVTETEKYIEKLIENEQEKQPEKKKTWVFKDVRLYINSINHAIESMKNAGIKCDAVKTKNDDYIEYVVKIPLK